MNADVNIPNLPEIIAWAEEHFAASDIHDISHWKRVAVNGKLLCECFEQRTPWLTRVLMMVAIWSMDQELLKQ